MDDAFYASLETTTDFIDKAPIFTKDSPDLSMMFRSMFDEHFVEHKVSFIPESEDVPDWEDLLDEHVELLKSNGLNSNRFLFNGGLGARVVGGQEAAPHSWPWQLFLSFDKWDCGAIMIHPAWALTASHCFPGEYFLGTTVRECIFRPGVERSIFSTLHPFENLGSQ